MNKKLVKKFGAMLAPHILPVEMKERHCPDIVFPIILMLRMLLGKTHSVYHNTTDDGLYTVTTEILVSRHDATTGKTSLTKLATIEVDTPLSLTWEEKRERVYCGEDPTVTHQTHGAINYVRIETALGMGSDNPRLAVLALLQLAATTSNYELRVETVAEGVDHIKVDTYQVDESDAWDQGTWKEAGLAGILLWMDVPTACSSLGDNRGNCAFQVAW